MKSTSVSKRETLLILQRLASHTDMYVLPSDQSGNLCPEAIAAFVDGLLMKDVNKIKLEISNYLDSSSLKDKNFHWAARIFRRKPKEEKVKSILDFLTSFVEQQLELLQE
jgi:hypothetical protein